MIDGRCFVCGQQAVTVLESKFRSTSRAACCTKCIPPNRLHRVAHRPVETPRQRARRWSAPPLRVLFRVRRVEFRDWRIDGGVDGQIDERCRLKECALARARELARAVPNGVIEVCHVNGSTSLYCRSVYVIELDQRALEDRRFLKANPHYVPGRRCFYVGSTGRSTEERFLQHRAGYRANRLAYLYGLGLCPEYEHLNPMAHDDAHRREAKLAEDLRSEGHAVWQH